MANRVGSCMEIRLEAVGQGWYVVYDGIGR